MQHGQSWVQTPTNACEHMICKYMDQKCSAAMLTSVQLAGATLEVSLRITTGEKAHKQGIHPGFETQGRCHEKSKTEVSVYPHKGLMSSKFFLKYCRDGINVHNFKIVNPLQQKVALSAMETNGNRVKFN